jgi:hypothetical protein
MRVRATCQHCGRTFLFFQLYNEDPGLTDRCPHCGRHLGVVNIRPLAMRTDRAAADLAHALRDLAGRDRHFTIEADSLLGPLTEAAEALARPTADWGRDHRAAA